MFGQERYVLLPNSVDQCQALPYRPICTDKIRQSFALSEGSSLKELDGLSNNDFEWAAQRYSCISIQEGCGRCILSMHVMIGRHHARMSDFREIAVLLYSCQETSKCNLSCCSHRYCNS